MLKLQKIIILILLILIPLQVQASSNMAPIISYLMSDSAQESEEEIDRIYFLEKDVNNKIFYEKYVDNGIAVTKYANGQFISTKILLDGDTNIFEIEYINDGVRLHYNGDTEDIIVVPPPPATIDSQYFGIWREDDSGDIAIAYIYTDKVVIFNANTNDGSCTYSNNLNVSEFENILKDGLDNDEGYVREESGAYYDQIVSSCGSYDSQQSYKVSGSFFSWFDSSGNNENEDYESRLNNTFGTFIMAPLTILVGEQPIVKGLVSIYDWIHPKVLHRAEQINTILEKAKDTTDRFRRYVGIRQPVSDTTAYDSVSSKYDADDISGIKDDVEQYEDYTDIQSDNSLDDTTFTVEEKNEDDEVKAIKVISYEESRKVEEIPVYDEAGNITSLKIRTNFRADGGYDEESMPVNVPQVNTIVGVAGSSTIGDYTRVTKPSSDYILYVQNVAVNSSSADQDILNSLNQLNFTIDDNLLNDDGTWIYFENKNVTGSWPQFHASWGVENDTYATCYTTIASSCIVSFRKTGVNEYDQNENLFVADYTLSSTPVTNPNEFCQTKVLKSFTQRGHIELEVGTYWPN